MCINDVYKPCTGKRETMNQVQIIRPCQLVTRIKTENLIERYLAFVDVAKKSAETYAKAIKQLVIYLTLRNIEQPQRKDIISFREELRATNHKASTIQTYIVSVRLFFKWTAQEGIYPNIADNIKCPKVSREHKKDYLTANQIKNILKGIDTSTLQGKRDYALISLLVTCGLRTIEVVRANKEDLQALGENTVLYIQGKGREDKAEYVKVPAQTEKAIREYLKERGKTEASEPLFASLSNNSKGQRMTTRAIRGIVKENFLKAGYDSDRLTAHSLRHTAVTLSLLAGKDITEVQEFARHRNIATTMIYNHALDKAKNSCSNAISDAIFA